LTDKDGKSYSDAIAADGSYALEKVPAGGYKVSVSGGGAPAKYGDAKTSPLEVVVGKGVSTADFELKGK